MPLIKKQPIGASSLASYPGQTSCSSLFGLRLQARVGNSKTSAREALQTELQRNDCEISLWSTALKHERAELEKTSSPQLPFASTCSEQS